MNGRSSYMTTRLNRVCQVNEALKLKSRGFRDVRDPLVTDIQSRLPFLSSSTRNLESPAGSSKSTEGPQATSPGVLLCAE